MEIYFQNLEHRHKAAILALYELIIELYPQLEPSIKWNAPNFSNNGTDCITFRLFPKDVFQVVLHRGTKKIDSDAFNFDDKHKICKWAARDRGIIDVLNIRNNESEILDTIGLWIAQI